MRNFIIITIVILSLTNLSIAQEWHFVKELPEVSNIIKTSVGHYEKVYILTSNGDIYYSSDAGDTWNAFAQVPLFFNVYDIEASKVGNRLYISTTCCGVAYTDNFGNNWQWDNLDTNQSSGIGLSPSGIDVYNSTTIAGALNPLMFTNELYMSNNDGTESTWSLIESFPLNDIISDVYMLTNNLIFISFDSSIASTSLRRSVNSGSSFTNQAFFDGKQITDIVRRIDGKLYCSTNENNQGFIYESDDNGDNWSLVESIPNQSEITDLEINEVNGLLYATTYSGVYQLSLDNTWISILTGNYMENIDSNEQYIFIGGVKGIGLKKSSIFTTNFSTVNFGKPKITWMQLANNYIFCGSAFNNIVHALNLENTNIWNNLNMQDGIDADAIAFSRASDLNGEGNILVAGINFIKEIDENLNVEQKIDFNTVNLSPPGFIDFLGSNIKTSSNGRIVVDQNEFTFPEFSVNEGTDWSGFLSPPGLSANESVRGIEVTDNYYFILSSDPIFPNNRGLYWSQNGSDWNSISLPNNAFASRMFIDNNGIIYVLMQNPARIYRFDLQNLQWEDIGLDLGQNSFTLYLEMKFDSSNNIYVLAYDLQNPLAFEGIRYRVNDDTFWEEIPFPINNNTVVKLNDLNFDVNDNIYARSASIISNEIAEGIYYYESSLGIIDYDMLDVSIYPNPVRDAVVNVKSNIESEFDLYDMAGRSIASGNLTIGDNVITINDPVADGIYILRCHEINYSKRLILSRSK